MPGENQRTYKSGGLTPSRCSVVQPREREKASFPRSRRFCNRNRQMGVIVSNRECGIIAAGV